MSWVGIDLKPGVVSELTPTALRTGYAWTALGRFKAGLFQKLGGWSKFIGLTVGGVPKSIHAWQALNGTKYLAIGSTAELDVFTDAPTKQTITPQTFLSDTALNFTTSAGSNIVTIVDANISTVTSSCSVYFNTPVSIDGIILSGSYQVVTTLSATSYTIQAASTGLAGVTSGGAVPAFTTTAGSSSVKVTFENHGLSIGSSIVLPIATTVGGISIQGTCTVVSVTDSSNFYMSVPVAAASSAGPTSMNSGSAQFVYTLSTGPIAAGGNYGQGTYGSGAYGSGQTLPGQTGTPISATDWTLGNWGEDLIACPENGGIYYWSPSGGYLNATLLGSAPPFNTGAFVSTTTQQVIAYGSSTLADIGTYQDPLLIKWCDVQNFFQWAPSVTNQAGSYRIPTGSKIVAGASTPNSNLIWTDLDVWAMSYIGQQYVFGFTKAGSNCGLVGKHAWTQFAGNVYWMGKNNLFVMSGGNVSILPCPVWDTLYQDLDASNVSQCFVGSNTLFSEVWLFYPSKQDGLGYPSRYVKFNVSEGTWDIGQLQRNCWTDQTVFGPPLACTNNGLIYSHETGFDADLSPMTSGFTTGYFYLQEGEDYVFIDQIIPDFVWEPVGTAMPANIQITVNAVRFPGDTPVIYGPYTVTPTNQSITTRIRARQISLAIQSTDSSSWWRLGHLRVRYSPDGRHG